MANFVTCFSEFRCLDRTHLDDSAACLPAHSPDAVLYAELYRSHELDQKVCLGVVRFFVVAAVPRVDGSDHQSGTVDDFGIVGMGEVGWEGWMKRVCGWWERGREEGDD